LVRRDEQDSFFVGWPLGRVDEGGVEEVEGLDLLWVWLANVERLEEPEGGRG
jgi:hypothetical protein